ncbi:MAG: hypothetical protein AB7G40_16955 [Hyphomonadaceae bacterium]
MAEIRETEVERDAEGRVVGYRERNVEQPRKGGGFGWGLIFGVGIIAVAIVAFAYSQGGFQQAGVEADRATQQAEQQITQTAENAGDVVENAGDQVEERTDAALN